MKVQIAKGRYIDEEDGGKEVKYFFIQKLQYGFYMRIIHDHFIPCEKCQEKLEKILVGKIRQWNIEDKPLRVELDYFGPKWRFRFPWIRTGQEIKDVNVVILCKECSKVLEEGIVNADEWTIGNKDYEPAIELWRRWDIDDIRTQRLDKILVKAKAAGIHQNSFYANLRNKKTTKAVDKYFDSFLPILTQMMESGN